MPLRYEISELYKKIMYFNYENNLIKKKIIFNSYIRLSNYVNTRSNTFFRL